MPCNCFTCSIHRTTTIPEQYKLLAECVYYATQIRENMFAIKLIENQGFKCGSLTDEGIEGELAAMHADVEFACCGLHELMQNLDADYQRLVKCIYNEEKQ